MDDFYISFWFSLRRKWPPGRVKAGGTETSRRAHKAQKQLPHGTTSPSAALHSATGEGSEVAIAGINEIDAAVPTQLCIKIYLVMDYYGAHTAPAVEP